MKFMVSKVSGLSDVLEEAQFKRTIFHTSELGGLSDLIQNRIGELIPSEKMSKIYGISVWLFGKTNPDRPVYSVRLEVAEEKRPMRATVSLRRVYGPIEKIQNRVRAYINSCYARMAL